MYVLCVCGRKPQFANLVTHPGFTDQLCYGDVSLRFMYSWSELSTSDRDRLLRENDGLQSPSVALQHQQLTQHASAQYVLHSRLKL